MCKHLTTCFCIHHEGRAHSIEQVLRIESEWGYAIPTEDSLLAAAGCAPLLFCADEREHHWASLLRSLINGY